MSRISSIQDPFLNALRREKVPVSVYLVNGIKLQGQIEAFDQFVLVLHNTVKQVVFKHAISTIVPSRNVRLIYSNSHPKLNETTESSAASEHDDADNADSQETSNQATETHDDEMISDVSDISEIETSEKQPQ